MKTIVKVSAIQMSCSDDMAANLEKSAKLVRKAADQGADIICLQELFTSRYFCQSEDHEHFSIAEEIPGPTTRFLSSLAKETGCVLVAGLFERRSAGVYHNSAVVLENDGSLLGTYRKMHIPDDPSYYEKFYFTPGDLGFQVFSSSAGRIGVCICWDQWFPEAARITAMKGAQILIYPTAIGWLEADKPDFGDDQLNAWQTMMRSHAIANGTFIVAPNRVGKEQDIEFWGNSFVSNPYGKVLASGSVDQDEIILAECDLAEIETARTHWPFFRDRRIDAYDDLTRRWIDEA